MSRLALPILCLVTDRMRSRGRALDEVVAMALDGGATMVQLREKDLAAGELLEIARRLRAITAGKALLFVNDRVDVALAAGADGVHLGETSMSVEAVRQVFEGRLLVGRSVHSADGGAQAESDGADLLIAGTVFPSRSHVDGSPGGVRLIEELRRLVTVPVLAIGGISVANAESVIEAGASGAAVVSAVSESDDPAAASRGLMSAIKARWAVKRRNPVGTSS